jgi:3-oxoadipate enol-lactonase
MPSAPAEKNNIAKVNATHIHYEFSGPEGEPVLLLSHSLGTDFTMWDAQLPQLSKSFRVLRYDTRGHGQSEISSGPYDFDKLGRRVGHRQILLLRIVHGRRHRHVARH